MQIELVDINIGEAVREGLKKKKMDQVELAEIIGVSQSLVSA